GYEAHLLTLEQIRGGVPMFERFYREVQRIYPDAAERLQFNETVRRMLNRFADDLIVHTQARADKAGGRTVDDVRSGAERLAGFSPEVDAERRQTKEFLHRNLYFSPSLADEKSDAERVVAELFTFWMEHPEALPRNYQEKAKDESLPRVV